MLAVPEMLDHERTASCVPSSAATECRHRHAAFGNARTVERDRECVRQRALPLTELDHTRRGEQYCSFALALRYQHLHSTCAYPIRFRSGARSSAEVSSLGQGWLVIVRASR